MAFLEARNIKKTYLLDDLDESDDDEEKSDVSSEFSEIEKEEFGL